MSYVLNTAQDRQEMLQILGLDSIDELFAMIPADVRLGRPLDLPPALGELELTAHLSSLAGKNDSAASKVCFLGGGSYDHFIPAVVDHVASRSEFYTSYTPYQAEVSQGNLQAIFEYQTLITQLTGMEVSNASMYDGASAAAEAVMMALAVSPERRRVVTASSVHPEYREVIETYLAHQEVELVTIPTPDGIASPEDVAAMVDQNTACVLVQQPNFFGCLEEVRRWADIAHDHGSLFVTAVDPISLGLLPRPSTYGADIVVAEGQSLGNPLAYGGPYLGILACREAFMRRLPGRLAGQTVDQRNQRCWTLTLQTREQHIRREKATSNICTNQGLLALRASVCLAALGPRGMRQAAELSVRKASYARDKLAGNSRFTRLFDAPTFKEFVIRDTSGQVDELLAHGLECGYLAGVPLGKWYPDFADCLLVAVTEKRTRAEIDGLVDCFVNSEQRTEVVHA